MQSKETELVFAVGKHVFAQELLGETVLFDFCIYNKVVLNICTFFIHDWKLAAPFQHQFSGGKLPKDKCFSSNEMGADIWLTKQDCSFGGKGRNGVSCKVMLTISLSL